jgi:hypothetical protein
MPEEILQNKTSGAACEAINGRVGIYSVLDRHVGVLVSHSVGTKETIAYEQNVNRIGYSLHTMNGEE